MPKIHLLPEHEARKIAAGEVVERPASVVKELLENAIDAGATTIEITIGNGGKDLIIVKDNGCGMDPDDARLSLAHHATSKIRSVDELSSITTFGFRGEALSSIASVSNLTLTTRTSEATEGFRIISDAGTILTEEIVGSSIGTEFRIEQLFHNIPARKKFLKQRDTEWRAIQQLVHAYALNNPGIGFSLTHDGTSHLTLRATPSILTRAQAIFEPEVACHLQELLPSTRDTQVRIAGIISDHAIHRYDRRLIFCYVNGRWVKNHTLSKAIIAGYIGALPDGKFPIAAIHITIPPYEVDINIHPRKEEVMLLHPQRVSTMIEEQITRTLSQLLVPTRSSSAPWVTMNPPGPVLNTFPTDHPSASSTGTRNRSCYETWVPQSMPTSNDGKCLTPSSPKEIVFQKPPVNSTTIIAAPTAVPSSPFQTQLTTSTYEIIGVYYNTYILLETRQGLQIIDQHAAHERVLYDKLCSVEPEAPTCLLIPEMITLSSDLAPHRVRICSFLAQVGIHAEPWHGTAIRVTATPSTITTPDLTELVRTTSLALLEEESSESIVQPAANHLLHATRAMMACKAAVKAGDVLSLIEQKSLLDRYFLTPNPLTCPHGRPTSWLLSSYEIAQKFKRK